MSKSPAITTTAVLLAALTLSAPGMALDETRADVGCWRTLDFALDVARVQAHAHLEYRPLDRPGFSGHVPGTDDHPHDGPITLLHADMQAGGSRGALDAWYRPDKNQVLATQRIRYGRRVEAKLQAFLSNGVLRERSEPRNTSGTAPAVSAWSREGRELIAFAPELPPGSAIETPLMLLQDAAALAQSGGDRRKLTRYVFTDRQLYRVELAVQAPKQWDTKIELSRGGDAAEVVKIVQVRSVLLRPILLGTEDEDHPFTLFELERPLSVVVDVQSGLPVAIQGRWHGVAALAAELRAANLAASCGRSAG